MRELFNDDVKPKISAKLKHWDPSQIDDANAECDLAYELLKPWLHTLTQSEMQSIANRYILPRLSYSMSKL
jgi:hypothetical protein